MRIDLGGLQDWTTGRAVLIKTATANSNNWSSWVLWDIRATVDSKHQADSLRH